MKIPRFVKEFADYRIENMDPFGLMKEDIKCRAIYKIEYALQAIENGRITILEAMELIMNPYK